jgi:crossover junction endodeoxyribonuclease RuvC
MIRILGVDPGIRGGAAIIEMGNGITTLVSAIDIPVAGVGAKERVNVLALQEWILSHGPTLAFIEHGSVRPGQGIASGYKFGRAVGSLEAVIALCAIPLEVISPGVWKRSFHLVGPDKEQSRQHALQLFPSAHALFARRKDHGRAEAALIAAYGARKHLFPHGQSEAAPAGADTGLVSERSASSES